MGKQKRLIRRDGGLTREEILFCKEYAATNVGSDSARKAYRGKGYSDVYLRAYMSTKLLYREEIREKIKEFRREFFEKYGKEIGDEVMERARNAEDKDAYKYYQQAINIIGLEAAKQTESKQEKVVSFPSHDAPQIEADVTIHEDEVPEAPLLEAAVNKDEKEDDI